MKILIVSHYFPPHVGGIENVAYSQAKLLAEQGHSVRVFTSAQSNMAQSVSENFIVIRVPAWNILEDKLGVPYPIFNPILYKKLKDEVKQTDIVQAHGHVYMSSVIAAHFAKRYKKPLVLSQHNTFIDYKSDVLRGVQTIADKSLGMYTLSRASRVITGSDATKEYMKSILPVEAEVHYTGVDIKRFQPAKDKKSLRKSFGLPGDKIICFTIRRITFKNGIDTMLETAKLLREQDDILFVIGGKGPDLSQTQTLVTKEKLKNVILLGAVSDENLPKYYAASDLFILPSKKGEGFPLVILEALASGLPVIATRSGGHVELIDNTELGYIVEPNRPDEIATRITELSSNQTRLKVRSKECRVFAEKNLSWDKNINDLITLFKEVTL